MPEICYKEYMKYIRLKTTDPYYNLAVEEYLLRSSDDDIFMLWQNSPTVVIGKNQNAYAEVNLEYAKEKSINVVRRITGGGAVYHDLGNLNYTFITSTEKARALDYEYFTKPVIDALATFGLSAVLSGRNDLEVDGKKFSGNAQFTANGRILHHGTLLFNTDLEEMSAVLRVDKEKLEFKSVKSHKGRVTNLAPLLPTTAHVEDFISAIENQVVKDLDAKRDEIPENDEINELTKRNRSREWIYSDKRYLTSYSLYKRKKYPFGIVCTDIKLNGEVIENITISGDFFGTRPIEELESLIAGHHKSDILALNIFPYIDKMTPEEFYELIK